MDKNFSKCPMCSTGELQSTFVIVDNETLKAHGCNKCKYGFWEPQLDTQTYSVSTTGTSSDEDRCLLLGKEIAEMDDEEFENNIEKLFPKRSVARVNPFYVLVDEEGDVEEMFPEAISLDWIAQIRDVRSRANKQQYKIYLLTNFKLKEVEV